MAVPRSLATSSITIILIRRLVRLAEITGKPAPHVEVILWDTVGLTNQITSAASLLMGQAAEGCPVVVVRGFCFTLEEKAVSADVLRPKETDLFR